MFCSFICIAVFSQMVQLPLGVFRRDKLLYSHHLEWRHLSGGQNLMTIGLYSYTPFAKPFAILSPPSFLLSRSYPGIIIFRTTFAGKVVWVYWVYVWVWIESLWVWNHPSLKQYIAGRNKQESVVEIGMGQPLMKGPGPFAKLSRIFRLTFADFLYKFPKKNWQTKIIPGSLNNNFKMDVWLNDLFLCKELESSNWNSRL